MTAESGLKWLLRFIGITTIPAFIAAVMPQSWVAFLIHKVEPGMSIGILVTYLARILTLMYAFVGLQCFIFASDIRRYLPLIWIIGVGTVVVTVIGLIVLFTGVAPEHRAGFFWVVFGDFTDGLVKGVLLVILLLRIPHRESNY
jgi:general stress protein CsbA